jgi:hypothetical protein
VDSAGLIDLEQGDAGGTANAVGTLAASAAGGGIAFYDSQALTIGSVTTNAPSLNETLAGVTAVAAGDVAIVAAGSINLAANIDVGAGTGNLLLKTTAGDITETGGTITSLGLTVDSAGLVDLGQGSAGGNANMVAGLAARAAGDVIFYDGQSLKVGSDTTSAPSLNEAASLDGITAGGGIFVSDAKMLTIAGVDLTAGKSDSRIGLGAKNFVQTGTSNFSAGLILIDTSGLTQKQIMAVHATNADIIFKLPPAAVTAPSSKPVITLGQLDAPNSILLLSTSSGELSGAIKVKQLGIRGEFGVSNLTGSINNISGLSAAQIAIHDPDPDNNYRLNTCVIGSPTCLVLPLLVPVSPDDVNTFELLQDQGQLDDLDIERLDTGNEDELGVDRVGTSKDEEL